VDQVASNLKGPKNLFHGRYDPTDYAMTVLKPVIDKTEY
jgi:hypothetical protein